MTLVVNDRVQEVSTSTGSGPFVLGGGVTGYQTFSVGIGNTNSTYYTITNGTNWMDILGTYTSAANSITVDKILTSSAGGTTAVSFAAGTKNIFCTYPAATAVLAAPAAYPTIQPSLNLDFANTRQLDPRITFVRNSTAAYYDGQTTAMAEQNLFLNSQLFTGGGWSVSGVTLGSAVTAPDGATTAYPMIGSGVSAAHGVVYSISSITGAFAKTLSIYVQAVSQNYVQLRYGGDATCYINFDLSTGLPGSNGTGTTGTITSVGSGWYRLSMTNSSASAANITVQLVTSSTAAFNEVNTLSTTVNIWGAQLEQRSSATAYTPTTTAAITNYIPVLMTAPAGVARFDCDPITGKSLGLLIEESRTNLLTYSSDFSNAVWVLEGGALKTPNTIIAPDGSLTGCKLYSDATTAIHTLRQQVTTTAISYAYYIYAKAGEKRRIVLRDNTVGREGVFDLISGVVISSTGGSGSISSVGNGWYRCSIVGTLAAANTRLQIVVAGDTATSYATSAFLGDGYSGIYIWGAQLEAGSFATSLIPTVASTVTRAADQASMTGTNFSSWYNQAQGTVYVDYDTFGLATGYIFTISEGSGAVNYISLLKGISGLTNRFVTVSTSVNQGNIDIGSISLNTNYKIIGSYITNNNNFCVNGGTVANDSTVTLPPNINNAYFGTYFTQSMNGHIRKLSYYPVALSSSSLVALTS
jgi:hypothetical protein